jgi:hypothetical protein
MYIPFLSLRRKTPSLLFMLREEQLLYPVGIFMLHNEHPSVVKILMLLEQYISSSISGLMKLYFFKTYFVP